MGGFDETEFDEDQEDKLFDDLIKSGGLYDDLDSIIPYDATSDPASDQYVMPTEQYREYDYSDKESVYDEDHYFDLKNSRQYVSDAIALEAERRFAQQLGPLLPKTLDQFTEEVDAEWVDLLEEYNAALEEDGDRDLEEIKKDIKNSSVFRMVSQQVRGENRQEKIDAKVAYIADNMGGSHGERAVFGIKLDQGAQMEVLESLEESLEGATDERKSTERKLAVCQEIYNQIEGDGKTTGMQYEANWIMENQSKIQDRIAKIHFEMIQQLENG